MVEKTMKGKKEMENQTNISNVNTVSAKRITRYKECFIEIRPQNIYHRMWWKQDASEQEQQQYEIRQYEDWAKELREFLKDHRSQDEQDILVRRITEDVCSLCGREWEEVTEDGKTYCASCGGEVEKSKKQ
jgi:DNA-directed RNA polymerase subunit RPC12/RpoP